MSLPAPSPEPASEPFASLDAAIDAAMTSCGDDPRVTVGTLLLAVASHEREIERLRGVISFGYVRGQLGGVPQ